MREALGPEEVYLHLVWVWLVGCLHVFTWPLVRSGHRVGGSCELQLSSAGWAAPPCHASGAEGDLGGCHTGYLGWNKQVLGDGGARGLVGGPKCKPFSVKRTLMCSLEEMTERLVQPGPCWPALPGGPGR